MDPNDNNNNNNNRNDPDGKAPAGSSNTNNNGREAQRRSRLGRALDARQQQQHRGVGRIEVLPRGGAPRPEEAPSSMGGGRSNNNNRNNRASSSSSRRRTDRAAAALAAAGLALDDDDDEDDDDFDPQIEPAGSARGFAVRPNLNRSSGDDGNGDNREDDGSDGDGNDNAAAAVDGNSDLGRLLKQLRQFCRRDGDHNNKKGGPSANAISVEMARNVLEACAGNVALAGQLYWDNYFASQVHHQQHRQPANPPPLDAPSVAAAAAALPDAAEEERRVRRRLEGDFERLLPHEQLLRQQLQEHQEALVESRNISKRRRRRASSSTRRDNNNDADVDIEEVQRMNDRNIRHQVRRLAARRDRGINAHDQDEDDEDDDDGILLEEMQHEAAGAAAAAAVAAAPLVRQLPQLAEEALMVAARAVLGAGGEDAAAEVEGSVSVSDDETGGVASVLRLVRERGNQVLLRNSSSSNNNRSSNAAARRRRGRQDDNINANANANVEDNPGFIRARDMISAQSATAPTSRGRKRIRQSSAKNRQEVAATAAAAAAAGGAGGGGGDDSNSSDSEGSSDEDDGYLSENDWLLAASSNDAAAAASAASNSASFQPHLELRGPIKILWGRLPTATATAAAKKKAAKKKKKKDTKEVETVPFEDNLEEVIKNTVGKEDDDEDGPGKDEDPDDASQLGESQAIPSTWWYASFAQHSTAMGVALKEPSKEDVAENSWRIFQLHAGANPRRNNTMPMPYHCRAMTAILSIVTALIHTGASVQANEVTCSSSRVPFLELTEEDRKREFESRLIDAISSLIFVAAKASMERKKKAVDKMLAKEERRKRRRKKKKDDLGEEEAEESNALQMSLRRKLKLCPVTWWQENTTGEPYTPAEQWQKGEDEQVDGPWIKLNTSYSNISDVRAYVLSNMRAFTAPGGVALLLETVVRIHGEGAVARMLRKSRAGDSHSAGKEKDSNNEAETDGKECSSNNLFLVCCSCEERQNKRLQDFTLTPANRRKLMNAADTTPPGHDCVSVELMSLLLTGKVHSTLSGWSTGPLGFGILSQTPGEVGEELSRPEKPVWILKGDTCYSVLVLDHTNHGENLNEKPPVAKPSDKENKVSEAKVAAAQKRNISPGKPKAAPSLKMSLCSTTSRSRDLSEAETFAKSDRPNFVANLSHWNSWFGVRALSSFRLITDRPQWTRPMPSKVLASYKNVPHAKHTESLTCEQKSVVEQLRERHTSRVVSADEREEADSHAKSDAAALAKLRFHPDDAKFYPKQHRRWRFDMGPKEEAVVEPNAKPRGDHWTPYFSLNREEQTLVETKFGPNISRILWNRWPLATIDRFMPEGKSEPLPIV